MPKIKRNKNHICKDCGAKFSRRYQLKQHMKLQLSNEKFKCNKCPVSFRSLDCLVVHASTHSESYCQEVKKIRHSNQLVVDLTLDDESTENQSNEIDDFNLIEFLLSDTYKYTGNDKEVLKLMNPIVCSTHFCNFSRILERTDYTVR